MNPATEALEDIEEASSLPNRTKKATDPESDEDKAMYSDSSSNSDKTKDFSKVNKINDAEEKEGEQ